MESFANSGSIRLRYQVDGDTGTPLLFVHEMGSQLEAWDEVVEALMDRYRCVRLDQRGCGKSTALSGEPVSLDDAASDLEAVIEASGAEGPVTIVAGALGAAGAVRLAVRSPDRVRALCLLAPALTVQSEQRQELNRIALLIETQGAAAFVEATLERAYPTELRCHEARFDKFMAIQTAAHPGSLASWWRTLAEIDMNADLAACKTPTLILWGRHDRIRPPPVQPPLPAAEVRTINSGHFMALQSPEIVVRELESFLSTRL